MAGAFSPLDEARRLAGEVDGDSMLPCPVCAASLKAANLDRHLEKVHSGQTPSGTWPGSDRAIARVLVVLFVGSVASIGLVEVVPDAATRVVMAGVAVAMCAFIALLLAMIAGKLPATLSIEGSRVVVHYAFGLLRRSVTLPPRAIEVGALIERRADPTLPTRYDHGGSDVKAGTYLRLRDDRGGVVTVGAKTGSGLRKHWQGWTQGGKVRFWDISVSPSAIVALEYLLSSRGLLTPRAPKPD